jgi:polyisoprenoid-binding protein YceI
MENGMMNLRQYFTALIATFCLSMAAHAAPVTYKIEPGHTYPSFEADHIGISVWRGKLNKSSGAVQLDKAASSGVVDIVVDLSSIDFGLDIMNKWAKGKDFFDIKKYPKATYKGKLDEFKDGAPTQVVGDFTLHGVTKPLTLKINTFKCIPHPMLKRDYCGADAQATFKRDEFGLNAGKDYGFNMDVLLRIQVEAVAEK